MNTKKKKERDKKNEGHYRHARIDRRNTKVNKYLENSTADGISITNIFQKLIDRNAELEAKLRQSEADKFDEVMKICSTIFKNMLSGARPGQLDLWMAAFKRRFMSVRNSDYNFDEEKDHLQRTIESIEKMERDIVDAIKETERLNVYEHLQNAIPIKSKG